MNYNAIAPYYLFLSRIIFGKSLIKIQIEALKTISNTGNMLIAGGGDGEILKHLNTYTGEIVYVELSSKMIALAQQKTDIQIRWINEDILMFQNENKFDTIFLPFMLDNLTSEETAILIKKIVKMLKSNGKLVIIDFTENPNQWQKLLLYFMYKFFRFTSSVQVKSVPSIAKILNNEKFVIVSELFGYDNFLEAKTYIYKHSTL